MCTATWVSSDSGYDLLINRDERKTRGVARGPVARECRGTAYIAPTDTDAGGSWVGVNTRGLSLWILNTLGTEDAGRPYVSRGLLLLSLMDCRTQEEAAARICGDDLGRYRPFTLATLAPGVPVVTIRWNGVDLPPETTTGVSPPLSSAPQRVVEHRRTLLAGMTCGRPAAVADLVAYHRSHVPEPGRHSVCMHGERSGTVSLSHVSVSEEAVAFRYAAGPACTGDFDAPVVIGRD